MEQNNQNTNEVGLPQSHSVVLQRLLSQLPQLNVSEQDRPKLSEALSAAIEALGTTSRGVELSQDAATEALLRVIEGRSSAQEEKRQDAVMHLASLVNNQPSNDDKSDGAKFLASLVKD